MKQHISAESQRRSLIRCSIFLVVLIALTFSNLFLFFRGLNAPMAIDQAQIAREISRGNGFTSKFIRPIAYQQASEAQKNENLPFIGFKDTYHAPLNPLLNAAILKIAGVNHPNKWLMAPNQMLFPLDRVIAMSSTLCFLISIGVFYLLISRVFDAKIATVTALLMLFSEVFWTFSLSGLPQMLMLMLFSCALYFVYRAVENHTEKRNAYFPASLAGIFFTLLSLTHYLAIWIAIAYIIFAALVFRPRGMIGGSILFTLILPLTFVIFRNLQITGNPFGAAFFNLYNGIGGNIEALVLRSSTPSDYPLISNSFALSLLINTLTQTSSLIPLLAGIIVAPLFFVSLLHPFKNPAAALFRWVILLMFIFAAFGLSIYGISTKDLDPNQIHIVFAPIMTAFGLAFLSTLWSKIPIVTSSLAMKNMHHIFILLICALPFLITLPNKIRIGVASNATGIPQWPPYFPIAINQGIGKWISEKEICFSDQPWAVAWYADRSSIWLPHNKIEFFRLENTAVNLKTNIGGILISPSSHSSGNLREIALAYKDFTSLVINGPVSSAIQPAVQPINILMLDSKLKDIAQRYPYPVKLASDMDLVYYSRTPITR